MCRMLKVGDLIHVTNMGYTGAKIDWIKQVRGLMNLSLKEAKDLSEQRGDEGLVLAVFRGKNPERRYPHMGVFAKVKWMSAKFIMHIQLDGDYLTHMRSADGKRIDPAPRLAGIEILSGAQS
jgi:hypothetical protein